LSFFFLFFSTFFLKIILKNNKISEASGSFAENQKITAIRKVYQKGVMNPMVNIYFVILYLFAK
jgi:hypothetical protein